MSTKNDLYYRVPSTEFLQAHLARGLMKLHRIKIERPQRAGILCSLWLLPITLMIIINILCFKPVL